MVHTEKQPIKFFDNLKKIKTNLASKDVFIFLDYDGTLTPIVDTPDLAVLDGEMRRVVQELSKKHTVSIVSGRATDDVRKKVDIENIFYAGSHGFEIINPDGRVNINQQAKKIRATIEKVFNELKQQLKNVPGALVEDVKYTITVHYRLVSDEDFSDVKEAVDGALKKNNSLRMTSGKKVFELRPKIDWDKGKAVQWILDALNFNSKKQSTIYIGDDTTDEDAFKVVNDCGFGIVVSDHARKSYAKYYVENTREVEQVLRSLL